MLGISTIIYLILIFQPTELVGLANINAIMANAYKHMAFAMGKMIVWMVAMSFNVISWVSVNRSSSFNIIICLA